MAHPSTSAKTSAPHPMLTALHLLLAVSLLLLALPLTSLAQEPRTIRVGYFAFPGYHELYEDENGTHGRGYGFDFLQMLRRYTCLNYEYVGYENSWRDMQQMLRDGRIDLVTSARKTPEREKEFAFSSPIGTSFAELSVRADDARFQLNDYRSFSGMTVGVLRGNSRNDDLATLASQKGFSYRTVAFDDEDDLTAALSEGTVDGIVASSLRRHVDEKVVARFALEEFYVIVRKGDAALLEEVNRGIAQMDANEGDWKNKLYYKYTTSSLESELAFTERELAYIRAVQAGEKTIAATAQPDRDPYSFVEDGELTGIIPGYFAHLMEMAGLPYSTMVAQSRTQYYEWAASNEADVYMDISSDRSTLVEEGSGLSTSPFIELTLSRVTKKGFQGEVRSVAAAYNQTYDGVDLDLADDVQIIRCATRREALDAVRDGRADACYVYTYMAEKYANQNPSGELSFHIVNRPAVGLSITIRPNTDHELISILNKCMKADQTPAMDELVEKYTHYEQPQLSFMQFAKQNPWFFIALLAVILGGITALALAARNSRNMRAIARERAEYAEQLQEKNEQLEESVRQAESASIAKTTFLNNMSHDIRTPMNAIIGYTNIALKQDVSPQVRGYLDKIDESSEHLLTLINDVLDISRIESGKTTVRLAAVDITAVLDSVIDIAHGFLNGRDIRLELSRATLESPYVLADALKIREVLVNIVGNAIKFTDDGGSIRISSSYRPGPDKRHIVLRYEVADTGIGMSEEFQEHIFEEFAQEHVDARTQYKGTGLGMAITKQYVEMMGGSIGVQSERGVGSTFTVELPLELTAAEHPREQDMQALRNELFGVRVLLAEDNDMNAEIAAFMLRELGMEVTRAVDGKEAVELFAARPAESFDVILMDIMMPAMSGYEATRAIRALPGRPDSRNIPIIAMTANAFAEDVQASLDAGMDAHLSKPVVADEVVRVIAQNLR
ncbi:MAG: ATP-binding protein [Coriobacteriales bacterium]